MAWNQPQPKNEGKNGRHTQTRKHPKYFIGAILLLFLAAVVFLTFFLKSSKKTDEPVTKNPIKRMPAPSSVIPYSKKTDTKPIQVPKKKNSQPKPAFMKEKPEGEWDSREKAIAYQWYAKDPDNQIKGVDMSTRVPPPVFSNLVQQAMAPYLEVGADVLPIGRITDKEAWAAIDTPIDFNFDDPDELLEKKQGVKEMLEELKKFMQDGGHAQDYFLRLESRQALEFETMQEVRKQVRDLEMEGDIDGAKDALKVYNDYLQKKGLPQIHMRIRNKNR